MTEIILDENIGSEMLREKLSERSLDGKIRIIDMDKFRYTYTHLSVDCNYTYRIDDKDIYDLELFEMFGDVKVMTIAHEDYLKTPRRIREYEDGGKKIHNKISKLLDNRHNVDILLKIGCGITTVHWMWLLIKGITKLNHCRRFNIQNIYKMTTIIIDDNIIFHVCFDTER